MSDLVPLHFDRFDVRMILRDGVPWWVLIDVCRIVGIKNHRDVASRMFDWQKDDVGISDAIGRSQKTIVINEAGVYGLLLNSNKPQAEQFAKWLFTEVLPSIRRFGMYPAPAVQLAHEGATCSVGTPQQRFLSECDRLAADAGFTVDEMLKDVISVAQLRALRNGTASVVKMLGRDNRWKEFAGGGMDLQYVINGRRTMTHQERRVLTGLRAANAEQQLLGGA